MIISLLSIKTMAIHFAKGGTVAIFTCTINSNITINCKIDIKWCTYVLLLRGGGKGIMDLI